MGGAYFSILVTVYTYIHHKTALQLSLSGVTVCGVTALYTVHHSLRTLNDVVQEGRVIEQ